MLLFALILLVAWVLAALMAVSLCANARRVDEELASGELAPVIEISSAA
jgi:hypothetical protein